MSEAILKTPRHEAMASVLLLSERSHTPGELAKRLRLSSAKAMSLLGDLAKNNLVISFGKGGRRYYRMNFRHPLAAELPKSMPSKRKYEDDLRGMVKKLGNISAAFFSGIFTAQPQLPVDLLLVGRVNLKRLDRFLKICRSQMKQDINYSIMSENEFKQRRDTFDRFIKDIFDYPHVVIVDRLKSSPKKPPKKKKDGFTINRF